MAIRVMLVEDEAGIRLILRKIIEKHEDVSKCCVVGIPHKYKMSMVFLIKVKNFYSKFTKGL